jgi:hypothetical protein
LLRLRRDDAQGRKGEQKRDAQTYREKPAEHSRHPAHHPI